MGSLYRPDEKSIFIIYFDATNLYSWAMSQLLPNGNYTWLSEDETHEAEIALTGTANMRDEFFKIQPELLGPYYILEVKLIYPPEIHNHDDDYPMAL